MILVTGGTGFIGSEVIQQLSAAGKPYRLLIEPTRKPIALPKNMDFDVALSSLTDVRGVRAALKDVDVIYHLSGAGDFTKSSSISGKEIKDTQVLCQIAADAQVKRILYLSNLGADRASAFQLLKVNGIVEHLVRDCGVGFTILRTGLVYGKGDHFTQNLARLIRSSPGFVFIPGDGKALLQPLWIGDLVTALIWSLDMPGTLNQTIEIGGPEYLSFLEVILQIAQTIKKKRRFVEFNPVQLGWLTQTLESINKNFPPSMFWLDYLAENRTCDLNSMSQYFGIIPARFKQKINYLLEKN